MKHHILVLIILSILFISCIVAPSDSGSSTGNNSGNNNGNTSGNQNNNPPSKNGTVTFTNNSDFDVNIYETFNPYVGDILCVVSAKGTKTVELQQSSDASLGDVFYFEYLIDIGNAKFPYWSKASSSGWKTAVVNENENTNIQIDELYNCETSSAYFLIENNTNSTIHLNNGNTTLIPVGANVRDLSPNGGCGVYEISKPVLGESAGITLNGIELVTVVKDTKKTLIPLNNEDVVAGNIYTLAVNTELRGETIISLKSVTPFNIDTQKKIWSFDEAVFDTVYSTPVMHPSISGKETIIIGTSQKEIDKVAVRRINEYGECLDSTGAGFTPEEYTCNYSKVVDFIEHEDGSFTMLLQNSCISPEGTEIELYVLVNFNFNTWTKNWSKYFSDFTYLDQSKNKMLLCNNNIIIVGGTVIEQNGHEFYLYDIAKYNIDTKELTDVIDYNDYSVDKYQMFTSAYCDGTDIYICGFKDWDDTYDTLSHKGEIWKYSLDLSTKELVYSSDRSLFFTIEGNGNNYVACGEYVDSGKLLKGFYVTKSMIKNSGSEVEPILYNAPKNYNWFEQVCLYGNKVILCGKAAKDFAGEKEPLPFVVAYDSKGNLLWENLSYTNYSEAITIIPNTIGTYLLMLKHKNKNVIHYVNADLLGNEK
ncbi:MAG: hypothetical protein MJ188_05090 [Treponema sp.]|nr:hypothetical protein [Treponema sp.]